jgi:hypothetical protein
MLGTLEYAMNQIVLSTVLFAVPAIVLLYLSFRIVVAALRLLQTGRIGDSLGLFGTAIIAACLVAKFGNEKTLLVASLLSWIFLASAFIRFLMRDDGATTKQVSRNPDAPNDQDQDPNSIHFSGVGRGFQGFGLYAGGVRIGHDPIDDD